MKCMLKYRVNILCEGLIALWKLFLRHFCAEFKFVSFLFFLLHSVTIAEDFYVDDILTTVTLTDVFSVGPYEITLYAGMGNSVVLLCPKLRMLRNPNGTTEKKSTLTISSLRDNNVVIST